MKNRRFDDPRFHGAGLVSALAGVAFMVLGAALALGAQAVLHG
ncbi:hypothetical protein [Pseudoxanthomonas mexicana]